VNDHHSVHDLLDRAVRDHTPLRTDPHRAVLARARSGRLRSTGLAAVAVAAVVAGVVLVVQPGNAPMRPAAPATGAEQSYDLSPEPSEEAARREVERLALEAAQAALAQDHFQVTYTEMPLVTTPAGWTRFTIEGGGSDPEDVVCSDSPRVIYQISVGGEPGTDRPCVGVPVEPYLWNGSGVLPRVDAPVRQVLLPDGSPRWVQTDEADRRVDVYFPQSGQFVRAVGVELDELLPFLTPAGHTLGNPLVPDMGDGLSARVSLDGGEAFDVPEAEYAELATALRRQPAVPAGSVGSCFGTAESHWQIQLVTGGTPSGFLVVDALGPTCGIAASTFGGVAQVDDSLLSLLAQLAAG